ncbi:MAG: DUF2269 family protein [Chloroflexota bacterium]
MDWIFLLLLFLHVGGAIVAFGPTFAFPILGPMAGHEPQHVNFALRFQKRVATTLIVPLALFQGITGLLLVWKIGFEILTHGWLLLAIALYVFLVGTSLAIGLPTLRRLIELTSAPPPAPPPGSPPPSGPPPHIAALVKRGRQIGMIQTALIVAIVFLMVTKPF